MIRGADVLVRGLEVAGTKTIFALSGNQIMPIFDALFDSNIRVIHTRHEAAAVYMAEAHAQISAGFGVALVTAGAGLGNAAGALIAARASDTPLVLLSGDSPVCADGRGAFQEMDQVALINSVAKGSRRVMRAEDIAQALAWAIDLATQGRTGPVHLSLPADVLTALTSGLGRPTPLPGGDPVDLLDLDALHRSSRPLIVLGPALTETRAPGLAAPLRDRLNAPVIAMESPRGLNDPALGRLSQVAAEADYVLCIGKSVDFTLRFGDAAHWPNVRHWGVVCGEEAQLTAAAANLESRLGAGILHDPRAFAERLIAWAGPEKDRRNWIDHTATLFQERIQAPAGDGVSPQDICRSVQTQIDQLGRATLICDGGEFGQWAQAGVQAPRRVVNGVSGIIGGGLCYAIAAKAADPTSQVIALMGDGTIGFHLSEFETAFRAGLPFVAVVGNDKRWNAEHMIQTRSFGADRLIGCDLTNARYDQAVEALGGFGAYVTKPEQLDAALSQAVGSGRPACINVAMRGLPAPTF